MNNEKLLKNSHKKFNKFNTINFCKKIHGKLELDISRYTRFTNQKNNYKSSKIQSKKIFKKTKESNDIKANNKKNSLNNNKNKDSILFNKFIEFRNKNQKDNNDRRAKTPQERNCHTPNTSFSILLTNTIRNKEKFKLDNFRGCKNNLNENKEEKSKTIDKNKNIDNEEKKKVNGKKIILNIKNIINEEMENENQNSKIKYRRINTMENRDKRIKTNETKDNRTKTNDNEEIRNQTYDNEKVGKKSSKKKSNQANSKKDNSNKKFEKNDNSNKIIISTDNTIKKNEIIDNKKNGNTKIEINGKKDSKSKSKEKDISKNKSKSKSNSNKKRRNKSGYNDKKNNSYINNKSQTKKNGYKEIKKMELQNYEKKKSAIYKIDLFKKIINSNVIEKKPEKLRRSNSCQLIFNDVKIDEQNNNTKKTENATSGSNSKSKINISYYYNEKNNDYIKERRHRVEDKFNQILFEKYKITRPLRMTQRKFYVEKNNKSTKKNKNKNNPKNKNKNNYNNKMNPNLNAMERSNYFNNLNYMMNNFRNIESNKNNKNNKKQNYNQDIYYREQINNIIKMRKFLSIEEFFNEIDRNYNLLDFNFAFLMEYFKNK